jgi:hypothetical protein
MDAQERHEFRVSISGLDLSAAQRQNVCQALQGALLQSMADLDFGGDRVALALPIGNGEGGRTQGLWAGAVNRNELENLVQSGAPTPTKGERELVVLRDTRGNTYLLDSRALGEARVPEEYRAEVEEALAGHELAAGAMRLERLTSEYQLVGSFDVLHAGGVQMAMALRAA